MIGRQLRLTWFQLREFVKVPYFVSLMLISTISVLVVQALAINAWGGQAWVAWVRSGIIGMWTTSTVAAGILGFERFKGTLVHLVTARVNALQPLAAVVSAASLFGLASFVVSALGWRLIWIRGEIGWGEPVVPISQFVLLVILLWLTCLVVSFVVATVFVLTPNAITYEKLLVTPVFLLSGLVFTTSDMPGILLIFSRLIPISAPAQILLGQVPSSQIIPALISTAIVSICWLVAGYLLAKVALRKARQAGTLEVM